jgi:hypothetical protein
MLAITAACSGFEGVAPGYLSELAPSSTGVNNVRIATGGAMVDGKYYKNSANIDTNIISAVGGGNTRIDRIVIRCTWADFHAEVHLLSGTDAAVPSAPAITQTSGTTYDIQICQVLVTTGGVITITDERTWSAGGPNSLATNAVTLAKMADNSVGTSEIVNDAVDDTKVGDRVPQFYRRQGGSATIWTTKGTTTYTPTSVRMQAGSIEWTGGAAAEGIVTVTFPTAFSFAPLVFTQFYHATSFQIFTEPQTTSTTQVAIKWYNTIESLISLTIYWFAVGPE